MLRCSPPQSLSSTHVFLCNNPSWGHVMPRSHSHFTCGKFGKPAGRNESPAMDRECPLWCSPTFPNMSQREVDDSGHRKGFSSSSHAKPHSLAASLDAKISRFPCFGIGLRYLLARYFFWFLRFFVFDLAFNPRGFRCRYRPLPPPATFRSR